MVLNVMGSNPIGHPKKKQPYLRLLFSCYLRIHKVDVYETIDFLDQFD